MNIYFVSAEQIGCEQCSYHGTCYTRNDVEIVCECFQWYAGDHCQINLKGKQASTFPISDKY